MGTEDRQIKIKAGQALAKALMEKGLDTPLSIGDFVTMMPYFFSTVVAYFCKDLGYPDMDALKTDIGRLKDLDTSTGDDTTGRESSVLLTALKEPSTMAEIADALVKSPIAIGKLADAFVGNQAALGKLIAGVRDAQKEKGEEARKFFLSIITPGLEKAVREMKPVDYDDELIKSGVALLAGQANDERILEGINPRDESQTQPRIAAWLTARINAMRETMREIIREHQEGFRMPPTGTAKRNEFEMVVWLIAFVKGISPTDKAVITKEMRDIKITREYLGEVEDEEE